MPLSVARVKLCRKRTLLAWTPVLHDELVFRDLPPAGGLLGEGTDGGVGRAVVAADHLVNLALAHGLALKLNRFFFKSEILYDFKNGCTVTVSVFFLWEIVKKKVNVH